MPKLLLATTVPRTVEAFLVPFANHFRGLGWSVEVMTGPGLSASDRAMFDGCHEVRWSRNPLSRSNLLEAPRRVREVMGQGSFDVVHVHTPVAGFVVRLALRPGALESRPAVVYTAHGFHFHPHGHPVSNLVYLGLEKAAGRWTDALVVINREDEAAALRHRIVPRDRLHYVPGIGVDLEEYAPERVPEGSVAQARAELGIPEGVPYFLMVAEFSPGKRHADLLRAFARARGQARLVLAGVGAIQDEVRALAGSLAMGSRVVFAGFRRDVPVLMRGAAAVVLPSEREGLPRCLLEAMAMEVPIVATRIRGSVDLLGDDADRLVAVGDVDGLARALDAVLEDPGAARQAARRGWERVRAFSMGEVLRAHERLYAGLLGQAPQALVAGR